MAYRRRPTGSDFGAGGGARRNDPLFTPNSDNGDDDDGVDVDKPSSPSSSSWLAAQAIRASSANRGSSLSSAYSSPPLSTTNPVTNASATATASSPSFPSPKRDSEPYQYTSIKNLNESKHGFWGNLARKAKAFLDDDDVSNSPQHDETPQTQNTPATDSASGGKYYNEHRSYESRRKPESPAMQKGLGAITSSLNYIGGTIGSAVEEGIIKVENRTAGLIQETRKHIRKKPGSSAMQDQGMKQPYFETQGQSQPQTDLELQLKASRDVRLQWQWLQKPSFCFES